MYNPRNKIVNTDRPKIICMSLIPKVFLNVFTKIPAAPQNVAEIKI